MIDTPEAKLPRLDADGLLPEHHGPENVPANDDTPVPAVEMADNARKLMSLFNSGAASERHYDLIDPLDGLTFGFANLPQAELQPFFRQMQTDSRPAFDAFVRRLLEVFNFNEKAWDAFGRKAKLASADKTPEGVARGLELLVTSRRLANKKEEDDYSFFSDNKVWFVPGAGRGFRDPLVVAYQVRYWESDILEPAEKAARALGLESEAEMFLLAFAISNPGQVPVVARAIRRARLLTSLHAANRDWMWDGSNRPVALQGVEIGLWHQLLLWQATCPPLGKRLRSRNRAFFAQFLAPFFLLPHMDRDGKTPVEHDPSGDNGDPARVVVR